MGTSDGSIIATIITTHMPRNEAAAPAHVWPGIRIHAIDIVQPFGIGISPIADMDAHQRVVSITLPAKSSAETPKKACRDTRCEGMDACSALVVPVGAAPPAAPLVGPSGSASEPLIHAPQRVHSARIGGIR